MSSTFTPPQHAKELHISNVYDTYTYSKSLVALARAAYGKGLEHPVTLKMATN